MAAFPGHIPAGLLVTSTSPASASHWPLQAQLPPTPMASPGPRLSQTSPTRPSSCLSASSPGPERFPASLSQPSSPSRLHLLAQLLPHNNHAQPSSCPAPGSLCRPQAPLSQAFQAPPLAPWRPGEAQLLPDNSLSMPSSCLTSASPGHVSPCLAAASTSPAPASRWPLSAHLVPHCGLAQARLLPFSSLRRPGSCLPMASLGSSRDSPRAPASQAPALWRPPQARLLHSDGLLRPSSSLTTVSLGPTFPLWRPPQAPVGLLRPSGCLPASSRGPALSRSCAYRPSLCLQTASFDSAPVQLLVALVGPKPSPVPISRPSSCLAVAFPGPDLASQRPSLATFLPASQQPQQARLLPYTGLSRPSLCLTVASPGPARTHPDGISRPKTFSSQPLQAQLLPPTNGLCRPKVS
ncbi:putative uncharacterized protein FLJ44672 [Trachypithecus francoisi]|uniref:putative uncharacterized protein FLJ44672 n=1 Tax=Trachypithecus francoisi TaxID=54180 RepID=UPI00141B07E6|nr:putative uncharacterized protein FLJ44672 [Trachypithecus francoisi]